MLDEAKLKLIQKEISILIFVCVRVAFGCAQGGVYGIKMR